MTIKKPRVLLDLWVSLVGGYAGIPQDTRTVFSALSQSDAISMAGLIYLGHRVYPLRKKRFSKSTNQVDITFEHVLTEIKARNNVQKINPSLLKKVVRKLSRGVLNKSAQLYNLSIQSHFHLGLIDKSNAELIWNEVFSKTLEQPVKDLIEAQDFYFSDIAFRDMQFAAYYNRKKILNTTGFDYMLFPDVRAVGVSPGTKKIVRYHDSFGFLCPDFFPDNHARFHFNSLKACVDDSYFVCNSEHTRDDLVTVFPSLEEKTFVIPPIVKPYPKMQNWEIFKKICKTRFSRQVYKQADAALIERIFAQENTFDYILSLSTLEPRKNYINLIRGWEKYRRDYQSNIKLVIVANKGWLAEDIERMMLPHIESGDIIHLASVPSDEIPYLFSHAKCFAYLSFIEGFGSPPLEGMLCECPVLASDNPTHRWTMGEAALYVDPYDVEDIARGMAKMISDPESDNLRATLVEKGLRQVAQYTLPIIQQKWLALFEPLNKFGP